MNYSLGSILFLILTSTTRGRRTCLLHRQRAIPPPGYCAPRCEQTTAAEGINSAEASRSARTPSSSGLRGLRSGGFQEYGCVCVHSRGPRVTYVKLDTDREAAAEWLPISDVASPWTVTSSPSMDKRLSVYVLNTPGDPTSWALEATISQSRRVTALGVIVKDYNLVVTEPGARRRRRRVHIFPRPGHERRGRRGKSSSAKGLLSPVTASHLVLRAEQPSRRSSSATKRVISRRYRHRTRKRLGRGLLRRMLFKFARVRFARAARRPRAATTANPPPPPPALILDDDDFAVGTDGGRAVAVATACALAVIALMG